jgi:predicted transcriptional regulator
MWRVGGLTARTQSRILLVCIIVCRRSIVVVRVTVTLPDELLAQLDGIAEEESLTRSDVVREAASSYVARRSSSAEATARASAVAEGVDWLASIAAPVDSTHPGSLEMLRELRGFSAGDVAPLERER